MEERRTRPGRVSLMRTAVALMGEHGYEGTSTRDIAGAAGVSVAALYYHFPSKLDLLREFLHEAHDVVVGRVEREIAAAGPTARAKLDAAVATLVWSNIHDSWAGSTCPTRSSSRRSASSWSR
jgi:AcrR family transcriptional regulator